MLDGGPRAAGKMATKEPVVLPASLPSPAKMETLVFVSLTEHLLKPLASRTLTLRPCYSQVLSHAWPLLETHPLLSLFCLQLCYSLSPSPLYLDFLQASLLD